MLISDKINATDIIFVGPNSDSEYIISPEIYTRFYSTFFWV